MSRFGEEAVLKLDNVIMQKNPMLRYKAAEVLHAIGGHKARSEVSRVVRREQVRWIAEQMRNMLQAGTASDRLRRSDVVMFGLDY